LDVQVRRHNVIGELVTIDASVTAVNVDDGTVDIAIDAVNQDGHESARGTAKVVLPTRSGLAG
jgi:hypothetical protein